MNFQAINWHPFREFHLKHTCVTAYGLYRFWERFCCRLCCGALWLSDSTDPAVDVDALVDLGVALVKYIAHNATSIVAHWGEIWVAICLRKWMSYSFQGAPWKSWLA